MAGEAKVSDMCHEKRHCRVVHLFKHGIKPSDLDVESCGSM